MLLHGPQTELYEATAGGMHVIAAHCVLQCMMLFACLLPLPRSAHAGGVNIPRVSFLLVPALFSLGPPPLQAVLFAARLGRGFLPSLPFPPLPVPWLSVRLDIWQSGFVVGFLITKKRGQQTRIIFVYELSLPIWLRHLPRLSSLQLIPGVQTLYS